MSNFANPPTPEFLRSHFKINDAEAQVAAMLCVGMDQDQIAAVRFVAPTTIRSQTRTLGRKVTPGGLHPLVCTFWAAWASRPQ